MASTSLLKRSEEPLLGHLPWSSMNDDDEDEIKPLLASSRTSSRQTESIGLLSMVDLSKFEKFDQMEEKKEESAPMRSSVKVDPAMNGTKISRVEQSWYIISGKIDKVGLRFFLEMFDDYPEIVHLFPFSDDSFDPLTGKFVINNHTHAYLRAHATSVMRVVGTCVAGLTKIQDLIPRLRSIGETHKTVGVQPMHYDILYRHMVKAIREEVGQADWDQETEDAWEQVFVSISEMIKRPSKRLETEPLRGWGIVILAACTYFMLVTPFRFAGFFYGRKNMIVILDSLDALSALVIFLDLLVYVLQKKYRVNRKPDESRVSLPLARKLRQSMNRVIRRQRRSIAEMLQSYGMDRWVPWQNLDMKVLLSFPLQFMLIRTSICGQIGLHWTQLFGLLRVLTASRVMHALQCAENNALIQQKLSAKRQLQLRVAKLLFKLVLMIHFSACMWCTVARIGLGVDASEFQPSSFFPSPDIIYDERSDVLQSYSRAVHWAFVNLSGIGGVESEPTTTLEVWTILIVHMIGAMFYAVITGNVIAILEDQTKRENAIGEDIVKLSSYLGTVRVSDLCKDRIMKGYMMRNVLTHTTEEEGPSTPDADNLDDAILSTLPRYLQMEVGIYARAELIRRCDKFFQHCSQGFLVALSCSLTGSRTLLSGDFLMQDGEPYQQEFVLIESGSLQVRHNHDTVKTYGRGECIGKAWLLREKSTSQDPNEIKERYDWLASDGRPGVSIRALSPCTLLTGLSRPDDIEQLELGYKIDFQLLRSEMRGLSRSVLESNAIAIAVLARCVRKWKQRLHQRLAGEAGRSTNVLDLYQVAKRAPSLREEQL